VQLIQLSPSMKPYAMSDSWNTSPISIIWYEEARKAGCQKVSRSPTSGHRVVSFHLSNFRTFSLVTRRNRGERARLTHLYSVLSAQENNKHLFSSPGLP